MMIFPKEFLEEVNFEKKISRMKPTQYADGKNWGQTSFSCSLYSEQAEQKSSVLEHLCWRTPEYSIFRCGADRTVT